MSHYHYFNIRLNQIVHIGLFFKTFQTAAMYGSSQCYSWNSGAVRTRREVAALPP